MSQPTTLPIEIYLGKGGQIHGPYTVEQFEALKTLPDFASYVYVWDSREAHPDWKPLPHALSTASKRGITAPPQDDTVTSRPMAPGEARSIAREIRDFDRDEAPAARPALRTYDVPGLEALCHDSRNVVTGKLSKVSDAGCELVCPEGPAASTFGSRSQVIINLLDPITGRSQNVAARLSGMCRKNGAWNLKVQWEGCPALVAQQLEK